MLKTFKIRSKARSIRSKRNSKHIEISWSRMVICWKIDHRRRLWRSKVSCRMRMPSQRAKMRRLGKAGSLKAKGRVSRFLSQSFMRLRLLRALQLLKIRKKKMMKSFLKIKRTLKYRGTNAKMLKMLNTWNGWMIAFCLNKAIIQKRIPSVMKRDIYLCWVWKIPKLARSNPLVVWLTGARWSFLVFWISTIKKPKSSKGLKSGKRFRSIRFWISWRRNSQIWWMIRNRRRARMMRFWEFIHLTQAKNSLLDKKTWWGSSRGSCPWTLVPSRVWCRLRMQISVIIAINEHSKIQSRPTKQK